MINTTEISCIHDVITDSKRLCERISSPVSDPPELVVQSIVSVALILCLACIIASIIADIILNGFVNKGEYWHINVVVRQGIIPQSVIDIFLILNVDAWLTTVEN
jgi:Na+/H+-translocating membrane pyrophosphatase